MALSGLMKVMLDATLTKALDNRIASDPTSFAQAWTIATGTGANQADLKFDDQRTLSGGANEDLDLVGSLADAFGATISNARIKAIIVQNLSATASIKVQPGASNGFVAAFADDVNIRPGGVFALMAPGATGYACAGGSTDILNVTNLDGSNAATYRIILVGASA